jgi:hypothetical protein
VGALFAGLIISAGVVVVMPVTPAGADTATFTSTDVGTTGTTDTFNESGSWTMAWSYDCTAKGTPGAFGVTVNQPSGDSNSDAGPQVSGMSGSGTESYFDTGTFSFSVTSTCDWSITVQDSSVAPVPGTVTYTSSQIGGGGSGSTPQFSESGNWTMKWSYDCSSTGSPGTFFVQVNQPPDFTALDLGPAESGLSGSGTDAYFDTGAFNLSIASACTWSITVGPTSAQPAVGSATFTNAQIGSSGSTPQFSESGPWTMIWSYDCTKFGSSGFFAVGVNQPSSSTSLDVGPDETGTSGRGSETFSDTGVFNFAVDSECAWSITVKPYVPGYWLVGSDGGIFTFGAAQFYGSTGALTLQRPVVGITPTIDGDGYWLVASDGGIFSFGDTAFYGSIPGIGIAPAGSANPRRLNAPIVGVVPSSDDSGYFMVGADGGVFAFGDAKFEGSCPGIGGCSGAAVAVMPDASGDGYWVVTATGHVYSFGDATYFGAPGPQSVPVTSAVRTPDGGGYWILFSNGAVAAYGDAGSLGGPLGGISPRNPTNAIFATATGHGYWVTTANGTVYAYGDAPSDGGTSGLHLNGQIIAATGV